MISYPKQFLFGRVRTDESLIETPASSIFLINVFGFVYLDISFYLLFNGMLMLITLFF